MKLATAQNRLARPFPAAAVQWRIWDAPSGTRAMARAVPYLEVSSVVARLSAVVGGDWSDFFEPRDGSSVRCRLTVLGTTRCDVGVGEGPDGLKGMHSDALKRAAAKFGVGTYLRAFHPQFVPAIDMRHNVEAGKWELSRTNVRWLHEALEQWLASADVVDRFGGVEGHGEVFSVREPRLPVWRNGAWQAAKKAFSEAAHEAAGLDDPRDVALAALRQVGVFGTTLDGSLELAERADLRAAERALREECASPKLKDAT